jgi:hypothetical protein
MDRAGTCLHPFSLDLLLTRLLGGDEVHDPTPSAVEFANISYDPLVAFDKA